MRLPSWLGRRRPSPEVQALGASLLTALAIVSAGWLVWWDYQPDGSDTRGEQTVVFGESDNGRLLFDLDDLALGSRVVTKDSESFHWTTLTPAYGTLDTGAGRVQLGSGLVADDALTEARLTFGSVSYLTEGVLHELPVPQDTLRLRVPGEPGAPGDRLLVVVDAEQSLRQTNGLWVFEPFVSEARWLRGADEKADDPITNETSTDPSEPQPSAYVSDSSEQAPDKPNGGTGQPGAEDQTPQDGVGKLTIFVRDLPQQHVQSLTATFGRVALETTDGRAARTYFDGERPIDLRAYAAPEDRAELVTFQLPATDYQAVHLEFARASAVIQHSDHTLVIPQPVLVIEEPFHVIPGQTTEILVDFSIEESLVLGAQGWEFRPVVSQFQRSLDDTDEDGLHDVADPDDDNDGNPDSKDLDRDGDGTPDLKPAQYRRNGSSLPTLGPDTPTPGPVEQVDDGKSRPLGSEGSVPDIPVDEDDLIEDPLKDVKVVGVPVWFVWRRGRTFHIRPR